MSFDRPIPETITDRLKAMLPLTDLYFEGANQNSVKAIASRLKHNRRKFRTTKENGGVRVWRVK